jgi:hypothetical protein
LKAQSDKREGFEVVSESCASFFFRPFDVEKLIGRQSKCPKCEEKWEGAFVVRAGRSVWAALVDVREFLSFWRRKLFWRMTPPFHSWVVWTTQPPVPFEAFEAIFAKDWTEES